MVFHKLLKYSKHSIGCGKVLLLNASYPYEDKIEMMVYDPLESDRGLGFICTTGYYAGRIIVYLPRESIYEDESKTISTDWLIRNWEEWGVPGSHIEQIFISDGYQLTEI